MLSNLANLKRWVLPQEEVSSTDFDEALQTLGTGVAGQLETYCNRRFVRAPGQTMEFSADRSFLSVPTYPIEKVSALEMRSDNDEFWVDILDSMIQVDATAGLVRLLGVAGHYNERIRVTWDGGYWIDETAGGTGTQPAGSTRLPDELKLAWLQQCAFAWQQRDKLGIPLERSPKAQKVIGASGLEQLKLLPGVEQTLDNYKRYDLS